MSTFFRFEELVNSFKSSSLREKLVYFNWGIVFVATVICMIPLFIYAQQQRDGHPVGDFSYLQSKTNATTLDNNHLQILTDDQTFSAQQYPTILISALNLGIALPSTFDLFVDIFVAIFEKTNDQPKKEIVRLSLLERSVFLFGVICNGVYMFFPSDWNIMVVSNIYNVFNNLTALLQNVPILIFLERATKAFSPIWTSFLVLMISLSEVMWCCTYLDVTSDMRSIFKTINITCYGISTFGTVLTILWCLYGSLRNHRWFRRCRSVNTEDDITPVLDAYENFNVNQVPALHMFSLVVSMVVCFVWYYVLSALTRNESYLLNTLFILAACLVMVIEMRVRANEVKHGVDLLESKRSFVRFISHEVRTPLSTAVMGLELLGIHSEFSTRSGKPFGSQNENMSIRSQLFDEQKESLRQVYDSIRAAEAIFDDLIMFDAETYLSHELESMALTFKSVDASHLVATLAAPLTLNAQHCNVRLKNMFPLATIGELPTVVNVDQRRFAQAFRTLVVTAIDRTPNDGSVTITAHNVAKLDTTGAVAPPPGGGERRATLTLINKPDVVLIPEGKSWLKTLLRKSRPLIGIDRVNSVDMQSGKVGDKFVVLEIAHEGEGFDKQEAKRVNAETFVFNPSQIHGGGGTGGGTGSGLGLSLAKTIVEAHGGRLWIKSAGVGKGSVFAMGLPLGAGACEVIDLLPSEKYQSMSSSRRSRRRHTSEGEALMMQRFNERASMKPSSASMKPSSSSIKPTVSPSSPIRVLEMSSSHGTPTPQASNKMASDVQPGFTSSLFVGKQSVEPSVIANGTTDNTEMKSTLNPIAVTIAQKDTLNVSKFTSPRTASLSGMHALVVEDSKVARTMLVKLLKSLKCTTEEAEDGAEAVKMVSAIINYDSDHSNDNTFDNTLRSVHDGRPPLYDFILCDSVMPVMDGPTATQKIRAMGYNKPIIGVTGNTLPEQIEDFIAHGADEIVTKPVKLAVLKETISRRCDSNKSLRASLHPNTITETSAKKPTLIPTSNDKVVDTVVSPLSFPISSREQDMLITSKQTSPTTEKVAVFPFSGLHALVVEDSKVARTMLVKLLKSLKCTTEEAEDGAEAVKMISAVINYDGNQINDDENSESFYAFKPPSFDFILCDSVMPVMDGPTAVQEIRAMGYDKPIIGVTGNTLPEQIEDFIAHGADEIVTKPVKLAVLTETIGRRCNIVVSTSKHRTHEKNPVKEGGTSPHEEKGEAV